MSTIYFDMDGTIVDLYGEEMWLLDIQREDSNSYAKAKPLIDLQETFSALEQLQERGFKIGVISWLSKGATAEFKKEIRKAKKEWLRRHLPIGFDELHFIQYGTPKSRVAKDKQGILFDDDLKVLDKWQGEKVLVPNIDINSYLWKILQKEKKKERHKKRKK